MTLTATARNSGADEATNAEIDFQLPPGALFVDASHDDVTVDLPSRLVSWKGAIDAGGTRDVSVRVIVPRDAGGLSLLPSLRVRQLFTGTETLVHGDAEVQTRPRQDGIDVLGFRILPAGAVVLALLIVALLGGLIVRARVHSLRRGRHSRGTEGFAAVCILMFAVGFLILFASMAWRDWRTVSDFVEASCTILDTRLRSTTATSTTGPIATRTTRIYKPLLALAYDVKGAPMVSTGFDTGSRLQIGTGAREIESFAHWQIGSQVPCWYDPRNPEDVVVVPGFGGAYFFALIPLPVLAFSLWWLRSLLSRRG